MNINHKFEKLLRTKAGKTKSFATSYDSSFHLEAYLQDYWHGFSNNQGAYGGIKQTIKSQIYARVFKDPQERDYLLNNFESAPMPEILVTLYRGVTLNIQTDWDQIIEKIKKQEISEKFQKTKDILLSAAEGRSKKLSSGSILIKQIDPPADYKHFENCWSNLFYKGVLSRKLDDLAGLSSLTITIGAGSADIQFEWLKTERKSP